MYGRRRLKDKQIKMDHKCASNVLHRVSLPVDHPPQAPALKGSRALKLRLDMVGRFMQPPCVSKACQSKPHLRRFDFSWLHQTQPGVNHVVHCGVQSRGADARRPQPGAVVQTAVSYQSMVLRPNWTPVVDCLSLIAGRMSHFTQTTPRLE